MSRLRFAPPLFVIGCAAAPPPSPPVAATPSASAAASATAPEAPAKLVSLDRRTFLGPRTKEGQFVVLGGRRALVKTDGTFVPESTPLPEALDQWVLVPTAAGPVHVGRAGDGLYRLDDPLGAGTAIVRITGSRRAPGYSPWRIASAPGVLAVWDSPRAGVQAEHDSAPQPRFLDLMTGADVPPPFSPPPQPISALAFRNARDGVAVLRATGLVSTRDGGATWKAFDPGTFGAFPAALDVEDGALVVPQGTSWIEAAFGGDASGSAELDLDAGSVRPPRSMEGSAPTVRWVLRTEQDPLDVAARSGVLLSSGELLAVHLRTVARIEPSTGAVSAVAQLPGGGCGLASTDESAWILCHAGAANDRVELYRLPRNSPSLELEKVVTVEGQSGPALPITSPRGGVLLSAKCARADRGDVCVRGADGVFRSVALPADTDDSWRWMRGPLADGRVVSMRQTAPGALEVVAIDAHGSEEKLASTVVLARGRPDVRAPLRELADGSLSGMVALERTLYLVRVSPRRELSLTSLGVGAVGGMWGARALVVRQGASSASRDGGVTFRPMALPPDTIRETPAEVYVSEVGAATYRPAFAFLGWGADRRVPSAPAIDAHAATFVLRNGLARAPDVRCGEPPAKKSAATPAPREAPARPSFPPPFVPRPGAGRRERVSFLPPDDGRHWSGATPIVVDLEGAKAPDHATVHWLELFGAHARERSWSGKTGMSTWGSRLIDAFAIGGSLVWTAKNRDEPSVVFRTGAGGTARTEVPKDLAPGPMGPESVAIGAGAHGPVVWISVSRTLVVWSEGSAPRSIAPLGEAHASLGEPTATDVPVLLRWEGGALVRRFSLTETVSREAWLTGVQAIDDLGEDATSLPACTAATAAKGTAFLVMNDAMAPQVTALSVSPHGTCVARALAPSFHDGRPAVLWVDLIAKTGERRVPVKVVATLRDCQIRR